MKHLIYGADHENVALILKEATEEEAVASKIQ